MDDARRIKVVGSLMLATFLTAIDTTIVDTAMPRIVGSLGGFSMLTWLITAYMLTSTASIPVYGKLADLFGRKRTFMVGAIIFIAGSALCGMAGSMTQLILFRGLQGLGAGAIMPVVQTIIGDIFSPAERAKMQGWFSSVWGVSALIGPLAGGLIVDYVSWRWLFYINLPLGILAIYALHVNLDETLERRQEGPIDYWGSVLLIGGVSMLLLALLTGGVHYPWGSAVVIGLVAAGLATLVLFVYNEQRHPDPMLPLDLFSNQTIKIANLAGFVLGGVFFGATVYLPLWAQGVQGYTATRSGASLLWLSIGWPLASIFGGRFILRVGLRPAAILGLVLNVIAAAGLVMLSRLPGGIPQIGFALVTFVIGGGMGFTTLAFILGVQAAVGREQRGVATASLQFIRTLGGLVWVAIMGAAVNLTLADRLQAIPELGVGSAAEAGAFANNLLDPALRARLPAELVASAQGALAEGLRAAYWVILLSAVVTLAITLFFPNERFDDEPAGDGPADAASPGEPAGAVAEAGS